MNLDKFKKTIFILFSPVYLITFLFASFLLLISVVGIKNNIISIGLILQSLSLGLLSIELLFVVIWIILKKTYNLKNILIRISIYVITFVIGVVIFSSEVKEYKIIDTSTKDKIVEKNSYSINENTYITNLNGKFKIIVDNKLKDSVIFEISHYEMPYQMKVQNIGDNYMIGLSDNLSFTKIKDLIINNLKNKKVYKYNYEYELTVYGSQENINILLKNTSRKYQLDYKKENEAIYIIYLAEYSDDMNCILSENFIYNCEKKIGN